VTLWLTEDVLSILCSWTSKSRYSLCSNRWWHFTQSCHQPTLLETLGPVGLRRMGEKSPPFIIPWRFIVQDASLQCITVITREAIAQNMLSSSNFVLLSFLVILCSNIRYFIYTSHDNLWRNAFLTNVQETRMSLTSDYCSTFPKKEEPLVLNKVSNSNAAD